MKTTTFLPILIALVVFAVLRASATNDDKYVEAMKKNIRTLLQAKTPAEYQEVINSLSRIAAAEHNRWEPLYYIGFGYIMMANADSVASRKDQALDQALAAIQKGKAMKPNESELVALEGFAHMIRVTVDPASRGPQYSGLAMQAFGKAVALNPDNPRALALLAQMQYGTAQFFGSGTEEACATLNKALEKFANASSDNPVAPTWGRGMAEGLKAQCP